jgi:hypothetical protein
VKILDIVVKLCGDDMVDKVDNVVVAIFKLILIVFCCRRGLMMMLLLSLMLILIESICPWGGPSQGNSVVG